MKGLRGVYISLTALSDASRLSDKQLRINIELELRRVGIKVFSYPKTFGDDFPGQEPNSATLDLDLFAIPNHPSIKEYCGDYIYAFELCLREPCRLERNSNLTTAAIVWRQYPFAFHHGTGDVNKIRDKITDSVKEFSNDYLAANPKGQEKPKDKNWKEMLYELKRSIQEDETRKKD